MTTPQAAAKYLNDHTRRCANKKNAVYNPHDKELNELPTIYGFNNGGDGDLFEAILISEDGKILGGHTCSHEGYMPSDLGILEGTRLDRHEVFRKKYPDGYRMEFVHSDKLREHKGLQDALMNKLGDISSPA